MFTSIFLTFMLLMAVQRIRETFFKKGKENGMIVNKWTLPALSTVHFIVGIGAIVEYFLVQREVNFIISGLGFSMYFFAFVLRSWAITTLGRYHSVHIEIKKDHMLIRRGPYKYMRHPYYLSVIFELLGVPLIPNSYYSFCVSLAVYIPLLLTRLNLEEKAMTDKLGREYLLYKREVWGLFPIKRVEGKRL
ncbi:MAG: isoprenylcysteine carboxylmethyltransferase family protein [Thermodesulfobacteriota bacterium]|nr:isoprenylcysteine carboxylmethyltransferase family protein [Thermodesulfobacteriota bacterium]